MHKSNPLRATDLAENTGKGHTATNTHHLQTHTRIIHTNYPHISCTISHILSACQHGWVLHITHHASCLVPTQRTHDQVISCNSQLTMWVCTCTASCCSSHSNSMELHWTTFQCSVWDGQGGTAALQLWDIQIQISLSENSVVARSKCPS